MKIILFFLFFIVSHNLFGQAKQLNELLMQYAFNDFRWKENPPMALQNPGELIIPHIISPDTLQVIKWKDIDSAGIFDSHKGNVRIVLYGKVIKYQKCKAADTCSKKYLNDFYTPVSSTDSVFISLLVKTHGYEPVFSDDIRKRFIKVLGQLNKTPVKEYYRSTTSRYFYDSNTKALVFCLDCDDSRKSFYLYANDLRNAKKVVLKQLNPSVMPFTVFAFDIVIVKGDNSTVISNEGENFNEKLLKSLAGILPGNSIIFDKVKVKGPEGAIRTIQAPGFLVK